MYFPSFVVAALSFMTLLLRSRAQYMYGVDVYNPAYNPLPWTYNSLTVPSGQEVEECVLEGLDSALGNMIYNVNYATYAGQLIGIPGQITNWCSMGVWLIIQMNEDSTSQMMYQDFVEDAWAASSGINIMAQQIQSSMASEPNLPTVVCVTFYDYNYNGVTFAAKAAAVVTNWDLSVTTTYSPAINDLNPSYMQNVLYAC